MALKIYDVADGVSAFSVDSSYTRPFAVSLDGALGASVAMRLFLRNDDATKQYSSNTITVVDTGDGVVDGSNGYSWKLIAGDSQPVEAQWASVAPGNTISLVNITDTTTYLPFWVRIEIPRGAPVKSYQGVKLRINTTPSAI